MTRTTLAPALLTRREAAAILRCSVRTVRRRQQAGDLPLVRERRRVLTPRTDVARLLGLPEAALELPPSRG